MPIPDYPEYDGLGLAGLIRDGELSAAEVLDIARAASAGDIVQYLSYTPQPDAVGDIEALSMWAGQGVAMVRKVQPAAKIVREINDGAQAILRRLTE